MWKRIICCILVAAMILTELPMTATAAAESDIHVYGDANGDGRLDPKDIKAIMRYIVEDELSDFQFANADMDENGSVDLKDLLAVRKRMEMFSVSFYDGKRLIDTLFVTKNSPLGSVPDVGKSSKENAVLLGY